MRLPVIQYTEGKKLDRTEPCAGKDHCTSCSLYHGNGGRCGGCTPQHQSQLFDWFKYCYQECGECTGHKVKVPAICCRSPLKDAYLTAVARGTDYNNPTFKYTTRPALKFTQKAVFYVSSGGVNTITAGGKQLVPDGTEVAAVNITRVWGGNGFYSRDLKDYLHIPAKTKLILMTMCLDDMLERAWNQEFYADPVEFQRVGLDAWMPLSFSAYPEEANMHRYYQTLRTLFCTEKSQAWFTTGDHYLSNVRTDDLILQSAEKIPQLVFNMQFSMDDKWLKYHLRLLKHYHEILPAHVSFWIVGASTPTFIHNARKVSGTRPIYFVSAKPLYLAAKGQELTENGGSKKSAVPKHELLMENFEQFAATVREYGS